MNIKTVSQKFDLSATTLRYYEDVGLIPPVNRNSSGYRDYDEIDLEWVNFAKCMRETDISIDVLKEYAALAQQGEQTSDQRKQILIEQQKLLDQKIKTIQNTQAFLSNKIATYEQHAKQMERIFKN
ncbi:MerR family transcriptional regulator [Loigolactobacillus zhaoyuanensis]|uniref:MerR family transcriptional regulator n=1 Tax=Loigolactobacillus zhaoyuanensis TaxID=2486017 RepID=UPI000F73B03A|nr:MerR family transcriptional regulator [Loigolactobacillus zhaoyuanensis]